MAPWLVLVLLAAAGIGAVMIWGHHGPVVRDGFRVVRVAAAAPDRRGSWAAGPDGAASAAATRYLCACGRDLGSGTAWRLGVPSCNNTTEYPQLVYSIAQRCGQASLRG